MRDLQTRKYTTQRYRLFRRILFPYSGTEPLTLKQALRVMIAWISVIPITVTLLTWLLTLALRYSLSQILTSVLFAFFSGVGIFGGLALLIIFMGNSAARYYQKHNATESTWGDTH